MSRLKRWLFPAAGLVVAVFASVVSVRAWRGESSLAEGLAAQHRGHLDAAVAAYKVAIDCGNANAAAERARLEILRLDWAGARESLHEAKALAPTRGMPHVLQAQLDLNIPGPWDGAREELVLGSCRVASTLEPHRAWINRECDIITKSLAERMRKNN